MSASADCDESLFKEGVMAALTLSVHASPNVTPSMREYEAEVLWAARQEAIRADEFERIPWITDGVCSR